MPTNGAQQLWPQQRRAATPNSQRGWCRTCDSAWSLGRAPVAEGVTLVRVVAMDVGAATCGRRLGLAGGGLDRMQQWPAMMMNIESPASSSSHTTACAGRCMNSMPLHSLWNRCSGISRNAYTYRRILSPSSNGQRIEPHIYIVLQGDCPANVSICMYIRY